MKLGKQWVETAWNPVVGCDKISAGCKNCYAHDMALRFQKKGVTDYKDGFQVRCLEHRLKEPYSWKKPHRVFINSMSDLFHEDVPSEYLKKIFEVMNNCPQHLFWFLTKRADNLQKMIGELKWTDNIMAGVTIESNEYRGRLDVLKKVPARYKFICMEPLVGRIERLDLSGIDWVVVGGESGANARPMEMAWVKEIKSWCDKQGVPFWFKQMSEYNGKEVKPLIDGKLCQAEPRIKLDRDLFDFAMGF